MLVLGCVSTFAVWSDSRKNGFDVSDSIIPVSEIRSGGPAKDGIPALDKPRFIAGHRADYLKDTDRVIGVDRNGEARAYPIAMLNWHEIVNDHIKGESIVITFCPLCGTGMVFKTPGYTSFGVSGLLYNSDVLLYDRATDSLWSQIMKQAVAGKRVGEKLQLIPASHTTWGAWRKRYPQSYVLSRETGFNRDYDRDPYAGYAQQRELYFPVSNNDSRYHPKEMVLAVSNERGAKSWPFQELSRSASPLQSSWDGEPVTILFDAQARSGRIIDADGEEIASTIGFWFAWMSFHPDSEVYTAR